MTPRQQWKTLDFNSHQDSIKAILDSIVDTYPSTPANNRWEYLFPLINLFYSESNVVFYTLYNDDKPRLCLPIIHSKQSKFFLSWSEIGFPFHKHINLVSLNGALSRNELDTLSNKITQDGIKWSRFSIRNILNYTAGSDTLNESYSGDVAWFNTTSSSGIAEIVSKKHLRNIRRLEKKITPITGELSFGSNQDGLDTALHLFSELEFTGWKGQAGVAIKGCNKLTKMYQDMARNFGPESVKIYNIRSNHHLLASALGFKLGGTLYIHKVSFNPEYSNFAPGNILLLKILEESIVSKTVSIVNLVTYPAWARRWHPNKAYAHDIIIYNKTFKGQLLKLLITSWRKAKPFIKRIIMK